MRDRADARGRAKSPVAAVVGRGLRGERLVLVQRHLVFPINDARRLAGRPRPRGDLELAAGPAHFGEIGRKLLLVEVDHLVQRRLVGAIGAVDVDVLHRLDDRVPALLVEAVLERVARRVAARAIVAENALHAGVVGRRVGQAGEDQVARHLLDQPLVVGDRREREIGAARGGEIELAPGGLEGERLRPYLILTFLHRREVVVTGLVCVDRGGDGCTRSLGRDGDTAQGLAGRIFDRAREHDLGGAGRQGERKAGRRGGGEDCQMPFVLHGPFS